MTTMDLERLRALIDAHGPETDAWPAAEREPALALLRASAAARGERDAARRLHVLLDREAPAHPPGLAAAVLARAPRGRAGWRVALATLWSDLGGTRMALPAFAAALALGVSLGLWLDAGSAAVDEAGDEAELLALAQLDTDYGDY